MGYAGLDPQRLGQRQALMGRWRKPGGRSRAESEEWAPFSAQDHGVGEKRGLQGTPLVVLAIAHTRWHCPPPS